EAGRITCTEPTVENAIIDASFTLDISVVDDFPDRFDPFADPCGGYIALENNLATLAMNVQEIVIRYEVPGSAVQVPDHSITFGRRIQPASSQQETPRGQPNLIFAELVGQLVPRTHIIFLNQNVNLLPSPPYLMNAFIVAKGQSDTGEDYTTNEIGYQFT